MRLGYFRHKEREGSCGPLAVRAAVSIHKDIFPARMTVQVTVESQRTLATELFDELLGVIHSRVKCLRRVLPAAVQVAAGERAAIVAIDDAVRVQHWHNLKDELVA